MKLRYEQLLSIGLQSVYYTDGQAHDDLTIEPTRSCLLQMTRFNVLHKNSFDGIQLMYECSPFTNDATPFKPILQETKFRFKVKVTNENFWYYADVNNWQKDKIYLLQNPVYNIPGNIPVHAGPLNNVRSSRPMTFMHAVPLDNVAGLLEVRDNIGNLISKQIVRARTVTEPPGKTASYFINLKNCPEGSYTLRHINAGPLVDEMVFCSEDYSTDTLAIIEITYKTGLGWTGVAPFQKYLVDITSRISDWFFDVHIRPKVVALYTASQLSIKHIPVPPEPLRTFSVDGIPDDVNGFVRFKSNVQLSYSQQPIRLQLLKSAATIIQDPLPLPTSVTLQKDAMNNLVTRIIVNV
ncbi:MAG: hypothetical protein SH808_15145 [Saprospiraceae bacterium]|nr:hypothetical protein [Saprospiraceae bacterium]